MEKHGWHFPTSGGGEEDGVNDSGLEMFEGDHAYFLAREIIQNSIDARRPESQTVEVHFHLKYLDLSDFPDWGNFKKILQACLKEIKEENPSGEKGKTKGEILYETALALSGKIPVLVVEDYGTTGLCGDEAERSGQWYKCIKKKGANRPAGEGGGTFGIGKHAPFPASKLRTIFYSTINDKKEPAFAGKSILSSFEANNDIKRGTGFYGALGTETVGGIRSMNSIPSFFRRKEQGLSVFIMGFRDEGDWEETLKRAVLENYFAAIDKGILKVVFETKSGEEIITAKSLEDFSDKYAPEINQYITALRHPLNGAPRIGTITGIGEVKLYLAHGKEYDRKVAYMRKPLSVVQRKKSNLVYEPFAGVFICDDKTGNTVLGGLEPPTHDKWDPKRDLKNGANIVIRLNEWINAELRKLNIDSGNEREDIAALAEYLAEDSDLPGERSTPGAAKDTHIPESGISENKNKDQEVLSPISTNPKPSRFQSKGGGGLLARKRIKRGTKKPKHGAGAGGNGPKLVDLNVGVRWIPESASSNKAVLVLRPYEQFTGTLRVVGVGEDDSAQVLVRAGKKSGEQLDIKDGEIKNLVLIPGEVVKLNLELHESAWEAVTVEAYDKQ